MSAAPLHQVINNYRPADEAIPAFEGKDVEYTVLVIRGMNALECGDRVLKIDDLVHLEIEGRVVYVDHRVRDKDGKLGRVQTVKAIEATITPFNRSDPADSGVIVP